VTTDWEQLRKKMGSGSEGDRIGKARQRGSVREDASLVEKERPKGNMEPGVTGRKISLRTRNKHTLSEDTPQKKTRKKKKKQTHKKEEKERKGGAGGGLGDST